MCRPSTTTASRAPATSAGFLARMASRLGLRSRVTPSLSPVASGPVLNTAPKSKPVGVNILTPDRLRARALRQNNRKAEDVTAYVNRHAAMIRGTCYEARGTN